MQRFYSLDLVRDLFKMMSDNEYSIAWSMIDDFTINGHIVSFKRSQQRNTVVIDDCGYKIGGPTVITVLATGKTYTNPLDYAMDILAEKKEA